MMMMMNLDQVKLNDVQLKVVNFYGSLTCGRINDITAIHPMRKRH